VARPHRGGFPGVASVETRVTLLVNLDVPGADGAGGRRSCSRCPPAGAGAQRHPHPPRPLPGPGAAPTRCWSARASPGERLGPGDSLGAVINGRWRGCAIVGIAISPDYIGEIAPGSIFPDDRRFGILRMTRERWRRRPGWRAPSTTVTSLAPGRARAAVIAELDRCWSRTAGWRVRARPAPLARDDRRGSSEQNRVWGTSSRHLPGSRGLPAQHRAGRWWPRSATRSRC
jgi:putative ABC transport system permease protein